MSKWNNSGRYSRPLNLPKSDGMATSRVTLKSLAAALHMHVSTVSRVLNGDAKDVLSAAGPETVSRIRQLAAELNYRPNIQAAALKTRSSNEIAVLMPRLSDVVMATVYDGIDAAADSHGYTTFVSNTFDSPARQVERVHRALQRQAAGFILSDTHIGPDQEAFRILSERGIPFVLVYRRHRGQLCVAGDDYLGGRLVAEHFYELGHRRVGVLAGERYAKSSLNRTKGFIDYFLEQGVDIPPSAAQFGAIDTMAGRELGHQLLSAHPELTAVFAINDFLAIGFMGISRSLGRKIGHDMAIVGYNDIPISAELPVPLTSVHVPAAEMGGKSVELLLARLGGQTPKSVYFKPVLNVRESSPAAR